MKIWPHGDLSASFCTVMVCSLQSHWCPYSLTTAEARSLAQQITEKKPSSISNRPDDDMRPDTPSEECQSSMPDPPSQYSHQKLRSAIVEA